jgi:hypothetical protein
MREKNGLFNHSVNLINICDASYSIFKIFLAVVDWIIILKNAY